MLSLFKTLNLKKNRYKPIGKFSIKIKMKVRDTTFFNYSGLRDLILLIQTFCNPGDLNFLFQFLKNYLKLRFNFARLNSGTLDILL